MKKTTINAILVSIIVIMSISICFLIFCIATRPRYVIVNEPETAVIVEADNLAADIKAKSAAAQDTDPKAAPDTDTAAGTKHGKTSTRVNIRDGASEMAKVIDTVEEGTTFDIIEIMENGWTKIMYQDSEAYISSRFVIPIND